MGTEGNMNLSNMYSTDILSAELQTVSMDTMANTSHLNSTNGSCPSIDDFRNQVYSTAYSMFSVFGLCGNGFALFILVKTYSQKTAFHIYMLNLAISDLLFICTLPLRVVYYVHNGNWFFGDFLCRITSYAFYVNLYCSIFMMTAMSFTRFIAIVFPVMNLKLVNVKKAKIACASIWIFVTLTSVPFLLTGSYDVTIEGVKKTKCFEPPESKKVTKLLILNNISLVLFFIIPFCTILVCYTLIIHTLLKNPMTKQQSSRKKAVRMIIIVMAAFLISFMPYHIQRTIHLYFLDGGKTCDEIIFMQKSVVITLALAASNCCFDPLLYFFSGENFRRRLSTFRKQSVTSLPPTIKHKNSIEADKFNTRGEDQMRDSDES